MGISVEHTALKRHDTKIATFQHFLIIYCLSLC